MADEQVPGIGKVEVGIVVGDLDAMTGFYTTLMGLEHINDMAIPGGTLRRLALGGCGVKLVRFDNGPTCANPPNGMAGGATGLRYLTIAVGDVARTVDRCTAEGRSVPVPLMEFEPGMRVAIVEDPEGNWIELVE